MSSQEPQEIPSQPGLAGAAGAFPVTPWSLVAAAAGVDDAVRRQLLGSLLQRYWPALRVHLMFRKGLKPDAADDLLQGFVADKVVEDNLLVEADRARGKFRTFLCTALDHYLVSRLRYDAAKKRAPTAGTLANLDDVPEPGADADPGAAYDVTWAKAVLAEAVKRTEAECGRTDRPELWALFRERILKPTLDGLEPPGYEMLVDRLKLESPAQASNLLVTVKRMFARILRSVVAEYAGEEGAEEELRDLRTVLGRG